MKNQEKLEISLEWGEKKLNAVSIIWSVEMKDIYFNLMEDTK